jgi:hypothetical protein
VIFRGESFIPQVKRDVGSSTKGKTSFNNMSMFSINRAPLMMSVWATQSIGDS